MKSIIIILTITCFALTISLYGQEYQNNKEMKIIDVNKTEIKETPHNVDVRLIYDKETAQAVHIKLEPGESLKPHITPVDVFFYILEGTPTIMVGEETIEVKKDQLIESPKDIKHCIYNHSKKTTRILVVKAPKPTQVSKIL